MRDDKFERFLKEVRNLRDHPAFKDDFTGELKIHLFKGGVTSMQVILNIEKTPKEEKVVPD